MPASRNPTWSAAFVAGVRYRSGHLESDDGGEDDRAHERAAEYGEDHPLLARGGGDGRNGRRPAHSRHRAVVGRVLHSRGRPVDRPERHSGGRAVVRRERESGLRAVVRRVRPRGRAERVHDSSERRRARHDPFRIGRGVGRNMRSSSCAAIVALFHGPVTGALPRPRWGVPPEETGVGPTRAGRVRPPRRPGMLRAHDDLRSHRGDRERPPARRRRPAAPHRAPLPGQARRRRRRPAGHLRGVRRRGEPDRARARRPRAWPRATGWRCCRTTRWQFAVARLRDRQARRRAGAGQLHARRRRDRLHPRATPARAGSSSRTRWRPTAEKALAAAGVAGGDPRLDRRCPARRRPAGWEDVDGWWRTAPTERRRTCWSATTTRCG